MTLPSTQRPVDLAAWIAGAAEDVFASLESLRGTMVACHRAAVARGEPLTCRDIAEVRPIVLDWLGGDRDLVVGAGMIVAPGLLADQPRRLEWWHSAPGCDPVFLDVDLDPESLEFYDYARAEWFRLPRETGARHVAGPYVDFGGTDRYMLTLTLPVRSDGVFLGVVGADVPAGLLEARLLPALAALGADAALVNTGRRVIVSTSAGAPSGSLLTGAAEPGAVHPVPGLPWLLLCPLESARSSAVRSAAPV
ncbi:hypothetical protein CLV63_12217 [Murinocardiopsis flavida]|uniref:Cache domain-containing protein n=1 Tax=Murinocardiopsis flavida TaxID=645275 RepID=A0A2P8CZU1_9ACTN|nr:cache domain-containing protein [Murinocardiopsis flavida]PSK90483.1 hypothetical protein CLV63_12217 [Murinocardiopsis flavida]